MPTAILVDGGYFIKRFRRIESDNAYIGQRAVDCLHRWAVMHLYDGNGKRSRQGIHRRELYRIFFCDCPPLDKKMHHPITKKAIDFSKTTEARFREELHAALLSKRKLSLRIGHLSDDAQWTIKPQVIRQLLKQKMSLEDLQEHDVQVDTRQKGVDMRIGVDVTTLKLKKQVDQIVLIAGDADFFPAAKIARREGIDFDLDTMWQKTPPGLHEHIDGLRTTCPKPKPVEKAKQ